MVKKDNTGLSRRKILKGSAAGALAAFGTTSAAAKQTMELSKADRHQLLREYQNPRAVHQAVQQQSDVLEELVEDNVLSKPTIDGLEKLTEPDKGVGERVTVYQVGERHTPQIDVFRRVDAGYLSISVFPEEETAHAVLNPVEDGEPLGEDHLTTYGTMPEQKAEPQACVAPWECYGCHGCSTYCCEFNGEGTQCLQTCTECYCSCSPDWC